jgi:translation elongation factor P/translation initiation factor 5A
MKKYFIVIIAILLVASCGYFKMSKSINYGEGSGSGGSGHQDSISINLDSIEVSETAGSEPDEIHHVIINSGGQGSPKPINPTSPELKIVTINNTKVISKSTDMSDGRVVYKIPERMKIRETSKVLLRIAKSKATVSVYDNLDGTVRTSEIPVTQTMEVALIDPSPADNKSFEIVPDNNAVQIVDDGETYTEWTWNVTPVRAGSSSLKIVVSVIRDGNKKDVVYEDSVVIERDLQNQISFFWSKYWQWLIGTFLLPFFLWLYKRKKDKKEEDKK